MGKRLTFNQRMDLAIKLFHYFLAFVGMGFLTAAIGGGMGHTYFLILGILLAVVGNIFFVVSMRIRYYESKPKWQQKVELKMKK